MNHDEFNDGLLGFLRDAPTPFHAVARMSAVLEAAGFERLTDASQLQRNRPARGYLTRNGSSIVAFTAGKTDHQRSGLRVIGGHTDSPCLKLKPKPELLNNGYLQLGVEVYGGALLNPWFDRDLSIAGRVTYRTAGGQIRNALIDFRDPLAVVPSLAIHLDRKANDEKKVNPQKDLPAILLCHEGDEPADFRRILLWRLNEEAVVSEAESVLDFELCLYDTQPATLVGFNQEFIAGARLDNLVSCYVGLKALLDSDNDLPCVLICSDHEEVGSVSAAGAQGPFLRSVLERWCESLDETLDRSLLVSADNAHGIHPNFSDRHDSNHGPVLNKGPVIKVNANQRYASTSETSALFRHFCDRAGVPVQVFVTRSDLACGSTIGPITSGTIGIRTVDVGVPQLAMHSIRELCGARDPLYLYGALRQFLDQPVLTVT